MKKNTALLYGAGIFIALALMIYVIYLLNFLIQNLSTISGTGVQQPPVIATFDLEGFQEIKKAQ